MAAINLRKRLALLAACSVLAMSTCALADGNSNGGGQDPPHTPPSGGGGSTLLSSDTSVVADTITAVLPWLVQLL